MSARRVALPIWILATALTLLGCAGPDNPASREPSPATPQQSPPRDRPEARASTPDTAAPRFGTYDEAMAFVRRTYDAERIDTSRSSWITGAEYYDAEGHGYLILGMKGKDYIFERVPRGVWEEFKIATSMGSYYNASIRGQYGLTLASK